MDPTPATFPRKLGNWLSGRRRWLAAKWSAHGADIVKTAIGAGFGAWLAFHVERYNRDEETAAKNLEAGLLVLATLESMEEALFVHYCTCVREHRDSKQAWLDIEPGPGDFQTAPERLDAPSLSFLLPSGGVEIYKQLGRAQEAYSGYTAQVSLRNRLMSEIIYPAAYPLQGKGLTGAALERQILDRIGIGPMERAHQAALVMLATQEYVHVIDQAKSVIRVAMTTALGDVVPPVGKELWPADKKDDPDCDELIEKDGSLAGLRGSREPTPNTGRNGKEAQRR